MARPPHASAAWVEDQRNECAERLFFSPCINAMYSGAISKSSKKKKKAEPTPTDPTDPRDRIKRRIRDKLDPVAAVMGKIEDLVLTGNEQTDSTPLKPSEVQELFSLVQRFKANIAELERAVNWRYIEIVDQPRPPNRYR